MFGFMHCKVNCLETAKKNYRTTAYVTATADDFSVGAEIQCPSGMGGLFTTKVTKIEGDIATCVKPYCKDHGKQTFLVHLLPPAISIDDLHRLKGVMSAVSFSGKLPCPKDYDLLILAKLNGLVTTYNSWQWTAPGLEFMAALRASYSDTHRKSA
ncbi:hypothetical protein Glaag_4297 (plasmid) [Glaciecola sp. 4H-3-7+YE-5]|jgi:hypothetical protein|nr:hypothetical protein Glaag_4297 [Glaciecola sp. 4H-3-7+YE-5]|tara:strand:+ start:52236 stop:52700 length:465 start_codon:yes stop_codon:yes gene_type:complete